MSDTDTDTLQELKHSTYIQSSILLWPFNSRRVEVLRIDYTKEASLSNPRMKYPGKDKWLDRTMFSSYIGVHAIISHFTVF